MTLTLALTPDLDLGVLDFLPDAPVDALTRRELVAGALAASLLAVACGGDDGDRPVAAASRTVTDAYGATVQIPAQARRIVTIDNFAPGILLSLGAPVVGAAVSESEFEPFITHFYDTDGIRIVGNFTELDYEGIIAADPDLIIEYVPSRRPYYDDDRAERLQSIAPFLRIGDYDAGFQQLYANTVELLGLDPAGLDALRAEYEGVLDEIRGLLGDGWKDVVVAAPYIFVDGASVLVTRGDVNGPVPDIIDAIGATRLNKDYEESQTLSFEEMRQVDCDLLVHLMSHVTPIEQLPETFQQLEVVKAGQVVTNLPDWYPGYSYSSQIGLAKVMLEQLTAMMPIRTDIV